MDKTREYSKYLLDYYNKIKLSDGGRTYYNLLSYYETGIINNIIKKNSKLSTKISFLEFTKDSIINFSEINGIKLPEPISYKEFLNLNK